MATLDRIRFVFRCAACIARTSADVDTVVEGERIDQSRRLGAVVPGDWTMLDCESTIAADQGAPMHFWLCSACAATPEESRALAALRHPIRILP